MINPIALELGPFIIKWYGIIMAFGFLAGILISSKLAKYRNLKKEDIQDFFVYLIPTSIIGARIGHIFMNLSYYINNPVEIVAIWHGGLAFQGGLIAATIMGVYFCKKRKIKFYNLADILVIPVAFALIFGRIANLINQELYGKLTTLPWGINIKGVEGKRHPSQIYESIKNLIIFLILISMIQIKKLKRGIIFWTFVLLYSILRFIVEFFRDWPTSLFGLTLPQLVSIPLVILSIIMLNRIRNK
jgi:phosphatidylglycerol---prolipoprotein diacylglyceryl transferase